MIWELPQNILGFLVVKLTKAKQSTQFVDVYVCNKLFNSGVSLGKYIIFQEDCVTTRDVKHEKGHQAQSKMYGWFYLLIVGLPSVVRNIWDRIAHKKWTNAQRSIWYYGGFPENQADKLGGVFR